MTHSYPTRHSSDQERAKGGSWPGKYGSAAVAAMKINPPPPRAGKAKGLRHDVESQFPGRGAPRRGLAAVRRPRRRHRRQLRILPAQDREDGSAAVGHVPHARAARSEEHTSELQSLMRISYAVFCL